MTPTHEQVAAWAREAGAVMTHSAPFALYPDSLQRFAALVAAHQAEQDAKLCDAKKAEILAKAKTTDDDLAATMLRQIAHLGCGDDAAAIRVSVKAIS